MEEAGYAEGSIEKKITDFYNSGMDSAAVEAAGLAPIREDLNQADTVNTIAGLQGIAPDFNWRMYFMETGINDPGEFIVSQPDFFAGISKMMQSTSLGNWKLYLKWQMVSRQASFLPSAYADLSFGFYGKTLSGSQAQRPRWKHVQETTDQIMGEAVGQLYVKQYFPPKAKDRMVHSASSLFLHKWG
ncbi:MAG: hypothetical protein AB7D05_04815 [Mangrovibacterium sp.]